MKNKKILLFLILSLYFFPIFVFAEQVNVGYITSQTDLLLGIPNLGAPVSLSPNTNNSAGNIFQIWLNIGNISINKDYVYQVEISTPNSTIQNVNSVDVVANGNQICNAIGFTDASIGFPKIYFQCLSSISNGNLSISLYDNSGSTTPIVTNSSTFRWNYTYLRYFDDDDDIDLIVSNATQNTNSIINNQNTNTQNIINNQNQNTQAIIDANKICSIIDKDSIVTDDSFLSSTGSISSNTGYGITDYISTKDAVFTPSVAGYRNYCTYNSSKTLIGCYDSSTLTANVDITFPSNVSYVRFSIFKSSNIPTIKKCINGSASINNSINDLNDNLNNDDSSGATSEASDFFSSFSTNTFGLTSIIIAPLNLIQSLTSSTCSELHLPLPYLDNKYLDLPCMSTIYSTYFGAFFTLYQTITYGIIAYWVCVRIFNQVKDFKNPEHDEIEVVDL